MNGAKPHGKWELRSVSFTFICCFTGSFTQQHFQHEVLPFLCFLSADKWRICFCVRDAALRWPWLSLQQWHLLQDPLSLSPAKPPQKFMFGRMEPVKSIGISKNLDKLLNCSFTMVYTNHPMVEFRLDLLEKETEWMLFWPSVEFRLKMQQFITVRVSTS